MFEACYSYNGQRIGQPFTLASIEAAKHEATAMLNVDWNVTACTHNGATLTAADGLTTLTLTRIR